MNGIFLYSVRCKIFLIAITMSFITPLSAADRFNALPDFDEESQPYDIWQQQLKLSPPPAVGCWRISYPDTVWVKQACHKETALLQQDRFSYPEIYDTVGNGLDYAA